ncbi:MAG: FecR/PupR family sigma factor regulator [Pseudomonadales bacterium]|nr:FecR/PupR family sigma factor regulator [Pseudomonadales bacterium]
MSDEIADQAITWFVRLRADNVTAAERQDFFSWLAADLHHQAGFLEIMQLWDDLSVVADMNFEELRPFPVIYEFKRKAQVSNY